MIEDSFLPADEHSRVKEYVMEQHRTRNKYPLCDYNHLNPPAELKTLTSMILASATQYIIADGQDPALFEMNHFQTHSVGRYNEQLADEYIMEPHHDLAEAGYYAMLYYVNVEERKDEYVGGTLAIYKNTTSVEYPEGIIHVTPKENRFVMFPASLVHRIKPYFSDNPRVTIATLMRKERNYHQNLKIPTL